MAENFQLHLSQMFFASDRSAGQPLLTGEITPPPPSDAATRVIAHYADSGSGTCTVSRLSLEPSATDADIITVLTDSGIKVAGIVETFSAHPIRPNQVTLRQSQEIPDAIELIHLG